MSATYALCVLVAALFSPGIAQGGDALSLRSEKSRYNLVDVFKMLEDPNGDLTIDDVSSEDYAHRFRPVPDERKDFGGLDLGLSSSAWWLRFDMRTEDPEVEGQAWMMVLSNHRFVGHMEVYTLAHHHRAGPSDKRWLVQQPNTHRSDRHGKNPVFQLPDLVGEPRPVYLRLQSDYHLYVTLFLREVSDYIDLKQGGYFINGIFYGILGVIALLNLLMAIFLRDRSALWYFLFVVFVGLFFLGLAGQITFFTKFLGPNFYGHQYMISICAIMGFAVLFSRSFLQTRSFIPKLDKVLLAFLVCIAAVLLGYSFFIDASQSAQEALKWLLILLGVLVPAGIIGAGIKRLLDGFNPARLYLAAWGAFSLGTFLFAVPVIVEMDSWKAFKLGCIANVLLLTLAIVDRLRILRSEREAMSAAKASAESALSETEQKLRSIADASTAQIAITQDNRFIYANQAFINHSEMPWDQLRSTPVTDYFPSKTIESRLRAQAEAVEQGKNTYRFETQDRNGRWFEVHDSLVALDGSDALITSTFDVTERKLAEEQMFRAEKMASLGQIIAGVAHEINNPNNFIYFNLPILEKYIDAMKPFMDESAAKNPGLKLVNMPYEMFIEDIYKLLGNMQHGSKRITSIVGDLKNYVRSSEAEDKKPESLNSVIDQVMTLVGKQVRKRVKTFEVEVEPDLPLVLMNAGKIEQVLINLVINAGQAVDKDDAWVRVNAASPDDNRRWVEVCVSDNGSGISEENQHKIFEPFFTTKSEEAGTGLGLAISQQIIDDHGGEIELQSKKGQGTTFILRFPTIN
ncbi:MAG: 7TM diverse intracellular signaling domain-containing protein [Myxococcota bacterium]|nr:7TM diverse intracellular signaling domain-containing protein [Myxococcota bacterium]